MTLLQRLIRKIFGEKSQAFYMLASYRYQWRPPFINIDKVTENFAANTENVKFIQIGANDGKSGDPIFKYIVGKQWEGILVEPVGFLFKQLKNNYAGLNDKLYFENAAIGKTAGEQTFYRLRNASETNAPQWYDQLGSFDKDVLLKHKKVFPILKTC